MDNIIPFGIGAAYVSDWGVAEAIREIHQNFLDYGSFTTTVDSYGGAGEFVKVTYSNSYIAKDLSIFKLGTSIKSAGSLGKYGEGLKLALLIFLREDLECSVKVYDKEITPVWVGNEFIGTTFGLEVTPIHHPAGFSVTFICPTEAWAEFDEKTVDPEDMDCVLHSTTEGDIIDKEPGDIYVGGIFVANLPGFNYAYNFKPGDIPLERDRTIPRQWDVEYHASKILETYSEFKEVDLFSNDSNLIDEVPEAIAEQAEVELISGKLHYTVNGSPVKDRVGSALSKHPIIQERAHKLKYKAKKRRKPYRLLKEFHKTYEYAFSASMNLDFAAILSVAKHWDRVK